MKEKINKILILTLLLLVPAQLGKHWWPDWSMVEGQRVDYLSPTLYLIDLVLLWILAINFDELRKINIKKWAVILLVVVINVAVAENKGTAMISWLRLGEWLIAVWILWQKRKLWIKDWWWIVPGWIIVESGLGLAQVIKGGSLQGWWYWLGERRFTINTIGIAQMGIEGEGMLRAYGTFSHPNSLAGFLLVAILWLLEGKDDFGGKKRVWWWTAVFLGMTGILVSGSRAVWVLTGLVFVWGFLKKGGFSKKNIGFMVVIFGLGLMVFGLISKNYQLSDYFSGWDQDGVEKRKDLAIAAIKMVDSSPILGVGAGNFLSELPNFRVKNSGIFWLQPVHNIPLLWLAEVGIIGFLLLGSLIWKNRSRINKNSLIFLVVVGVTGMIDHYWVTLPQNRWLLAVWAVWWMERKMGDKK